MPRPFPPRSCRTGSPVTCTPSSSSGPCRAWWSDNLRSGVTKAHRYEPRSTPPTRRWPPTTAWPSSPPGPTSLGTRPRSRRRAVGRTLDPGPARHQRFTSLAECNAAMPPAYGINDRPFKKMDGSRRSLFDEIDRPARAPARAALRVRQLEGAEGQHRLPPRGGPPLLLRPLPAGR